METGAPDDVGVVATAAVAEAVLGVIFSVEAMRLRLRLPERSTESLRRLSTSVMVPSMLFESARQDSGCGVEVVAREGLSNGVLVRAKEDLGGLPLPLCG